MQEEKALPSKHFRESLTHVLAELRDTLIVEHERATGHQEQVLRQEVNALRQEMQVSQGPSRHKDVADMGHGPVVVPTYSHSELKGGFNGEALAYSSLPDGVLACLNAKCGSMNGVVARDDSGGTKLQVGTVPEKRMPVKVRKTRNLDRFRISPNMQRAIFSEELIGILNPSLKSCTKKEDSHHSDIVLGTTKAIDDMEEESSRLPSCLQKLRSSLRLQARLVDCLIGIAITLNVLAVGVSLDWQPNWSGWLAVDAVFAVVFFSETALRLWVFGRRFFLGPEWTWNVFEAALAVFNVLEFALNCSGAMGPPDSTFVQAIRLTRIARLLRIRRLRIFGDFPVMVRSGFDGLRLLSWAVVVIALPLYAFALFFRETVGVPLATEDGAELFSSVGLSLFTMFRCAVANDCSEESGRHIFHVLLKSHGWFFTFLYTMAVVCVAFGVCSFIMALLVENVVSMAKSSEYFVRKRRRSEEAYFDQKVRELVQVIWDHNTKAQKTAPASGGLRRIGTGGFKSKETDCKGLADIRITPELLKELRQNEHFVQALQDLDLAEEDQSDLFETLDFDSNGVINLEELVTGLAKLCGEARRSDLVQIDRTVRSLHQEQAQLFKDTLTAVRAQDCVMRSILECVCRRREDTGFPLLNKLDLD